MPEMKEKWVEIVLTTPAELSDALSNFLEELDTKGVFQEEGDVDPFDNRSTKGKTEVIKAYLPWGKEARKKLRLLEDYIESLSELFPKLQRAVFITSTIVDPDWSEQWKKYFKPLRISRNIIIKPTWERYTPSGRDIVVDIDPGMAFGTGQHPSTEMCITALEDILLKERAFEKWNTLDIGTGTGILAICAVKLGADQIKAIDIDPRAVEAAGVNAEINGVDDRIDVENMDVALCKGTYNLIIANLTAATLIKIHSHLIPMMDDGGYLIASGIIEQDKENIERLFLDENISLHEMKQDKEWLCYVFKKRETHP